MLLVCLDDGRLSGGAPLSQNILSAENQKLTDTGGKFPACSQPQEQATDDERERGRRFPFDTQKNHILISLYEDVIVL